MFRLGEQKMDFRGRKDFAMKFHWVTLLLLEARSIVKDLQAFGRLLTVDWFPHSFVVILLIGLVLYGAWLEYGFCKKGRD